VSEPECPDGAEKEQLKVPLAEHVEGVVETLDPANVMEMRTESVLDPNPEPLTVTVVPAGPEIGERLIDAASGWSPAAPPPGAARVGAALRAPPRPGSPTTARTDTTTTIATRTAPCGRRPTYIRSPDHPRSLAVGCANGRGVRPILMWVPAVGASRLSTPY
jgi:hypothetical protein